MNAYTSDDDRRYVRVVCPTCRAVLHPRVEKAGRRVRCPDCYAAVLVPEPPPPEPPSKPVRNPGEYKVAEKGATVKQPEVFLLLCPTCGARLYPRLGYVGKKVRCPDCEVVIVVPPPPPPEKTKELKSPGHYRVGVEPARVEVKQELLLAPSERPEQPPPDEVPRFWFVSGVLLFPWTMSAASHWMVLSMFLLPLAVIIAAIAFLMDGLHMGSSALAMLIVPLAWTFVLSMSYAAACSLSIMQDTATGMNAVEQWPEGSWRERIGPFAYVALEFFIGAALASLLAWPVGLFAGPIWGGALAVALTAFTFPFFLLSALEADSPMSPYSPVILGSTAKLWWAWLLVGVESLVILVLVVALSVLSLLASPVLTLFVAPPLLAACIFIVARLYGRLAWRIGEWEMGKKRRKKKKKKKPAQDAVPAGE